MGSRRVGGKLLPEAAKFRRALNRLHGEPFFPVEENL
jgi:hypothetical protein